MWPPHHHTSAPLLSSSLLSLQTLPLKKNLYKEIHSKMLEMNQNEILKKMVK